MLAALAMSQQEVTPAAADAGGDNPYNDPSFVSDLLSQIPGLDLDPNDPSFVVRPDVALLL